MRRSIVLALLSLALPVMATQGCAAPGPRNQTTVTAKFEVEATEPVGALLGGGSCIGREPGEDRPGVTARAFVEVRWVGRGGTLMAE